MVPYEHLNGYSESRQTEFITALWWKKTTTYFYSLTTVTLAAIITTCIHVAECT